MKNIPRSLTLSSHLLLFAATLITLLGAAIRITNLGSDSLWFDEVLTLNTAVQGIMAANQVRDHPPLLYWLTSASVNLFPIHEVTLRLPSLLAGILTIPLLIGIGETAGLPWTGLWAGFLLAFSPFHVRYTQEARHYALLLFFALISMNLLYRAINHGRWQNWLKYGALTSVLLFVHYSAWLLLLAEGVMIIGWLIVLLRQRDYHSMVTIWPAVVPLLLGLIILFPRAILTLEANTGQSAAVGTTPAAELVTWLSNAQLSFGFNDPLLAALLLVSALAGLLILAYHRRWLLLSLILITSIVPLALIQILAVSRWALPKYIIYLLPSYLLAAGVSLEALTGWLANAIPWPRQERQRRLAIVLFLCLGLLALALPRLREEHSYMLRDWRGAIASLGEPSTNSVVVALALDTDGFNAGGVVAPHYLPEGYHLLDGNHLDLNAVKRLSGRDGQLFALLLNSSQPVTVADSAWQLTEYQGHLYVLQHQGAQSDLTEQLLSLYKESLPNALQPVPQCALRQKIALIHLVREDYAAAQQVLSTVDPQCPLGAGEKARLQTAVTQGLLNVSVKQGQRDRAVVLAESLLADNPKDKLALDTLTVVDLLQQFESGLAAVENEPAANPLQKRRFTMPHNGDWEDVLFMHPPASLHFMIDLPDEPAILRFRNALAPESWDWGGDGVTFVATIQAQEGAPEEIFRQHISNDMADRDWHSAEISLAAYAGSTLNLTLATENGPLGDGTGDWAGWGAPRILRTSSSE